MKLSKDSLLLLFKLNFFVPYILFNDFILSLFFIAVLINVLVEAP